MARLDPALEDRLQELARPDLYGMCGHCQRTVTNEDPDHRVTPILEGGRGVECRKRGDYA